MSNLTDRGYFVLADILKIKIDNFSAISQKHIKIFAHITENLLFTNKQGCGNLPNKQPGHFEKFFLPLGIKLIVKG